MKSKRDTEIAIIAWLICMGVDVIVNGFSHAALNFTTGMMIGVGIKLGYEIWEHRKTNHPNEIIPEPSQSEVEQVL